MRKEPLKLFLTKEQMTVLRRSTGSEVQWFDSGLAKIAGTEPPEYKAIICGDIYVYAHK